MKEKMLPEFQLRKHSKVEKQLVSAVLRGARLPSTCFVTLSCFKTNVFGDTIKYKSDEYHTQSPNTLPGHPSDTVFKVQKIINNHFKYGNK